MFRQLLIFPSSADLATVERIVTDEIGPFYRGSDGFRSLSMSAGPLMGPAARDGGAAVVVEAVFESLESSLATIMAPSFQVDQGRGRIARGSDLPLRDARALTTSMAAGSSVTATIQRLTKTSGGLRWHESTQSG